MRLHVIARFLFIIVEILNAYRSDFIVFIVRLTQSRKKYLKITQVTSRYWRYIGHT